MADLDVRAAAMSVLREFAATANAAVRQRIREALSTTDPTLTDVSDLRDVLLSGTSTDEQKRRAVDLLIEILKG